MTGRSLDGAVIVWRCPLGHKFIEWGNRQQSTFPRNLERKAESP